MSYEGLEQLLRFLFVLGITHVLYSGIAIGLAMSKVELVSVAYFFLDISMLFGKEDILAITFIRLFGECREPL